MSIAVFVIGINVGTERWALRDRSIREHINWDQMDCNVSWTMYKVFMKFMVTCVTDSITSWEVSYKTTSCTKKCMTHDQPVCAYGAIRHIAIQSHRCLRQTIFVYKVASILNANNMKYCPDSGGNSLTDRLLTIPSLLCKYLRGTSLECYGKQ